MDRRDKALFVLLDFVLVIIALNLATPNLGLLQENTEFPKCPSAQIVDEEMYMDTRKPNTSSINNHFSDSLPPTRTEINSEGFRDDHFNISKPSNQFRIVAIGDSFTIGMGLNDSQRYSEILEKKLDESMEKDVKVLNMGLGGAGMKDYYQILYNKGTRYDPDMVIIGQTLNDAVSRENHDRRLKKTYEKFNISSVEELKSSDDAESYFHNLRNDQKKWKDSEFRTYAARINELGSQKQYEVVFYKLDPRAIGLNKKPVLGLEYKTALDYWDANCDFNYITAPKYLKKNKTYTFYPNLHYNQRGNEVLADHLYQKIQPFLPESEEGKPNTLTS